MCVYVCGLFLQDAKRYKQRMQDIECCFFFSLIWSIGRFSLCIFILYEYVNDVFVLIYFNNRGGTYFIPLNLRKKWICRVANEV